MQLILDILHEYRLIFSLKKEATLSKAPTQWQEGTKGDVILVPGYGESWTFFKLIGQVAHEANYRVHIPQQLLNNHLSIDNSIQLLETYFKTHSLKQTILIGHSKGGLIIQQFLETPYGEKIEKAITISTPFSGTLIGYAKINFLWEMQLHKFAPTKNLDKIINLYAKKDNHILPNKNALLPGGVNIEIPITGHTRILQSQQTLEEIRKVLV